MDKATNPKPFVFVLMPFDKKFEDVYQLGIKEACEGAGAYCERVDEQDYYGTILDRIFNQIAKADIIVADMTGKNPNVFYETGYAHALNKKVILLTQDSKDIPFDLKNQKHIVYEGSIVNLHRELKKTISWSLKHPRESLAKAEFTVEFFIQGIKLEGTPEINIESARKEVGIIFLPIMCAFHNTSDKTFQGPLSLGLITGKEFPSNELGWSIAKLPDEKYLHHLPKIVELLPDEWGSFNFVLRTSAMAGFRFIKYDFVLCAYTEFGAKQLNFQVNMERLVAPENKSNEHLK